jgi:hypothetical protein
MNHLFITNFLVDEDKMALNLAATLNSNASKQIDWLNFKDFETDHIDHLINTKQILLLETQSKEDLTQHLIPLFVRYEQPTFLILGSLSKISSQMQQGLLRFIEEPPYNLNLILTARNKTQALTTIVSRCELKVIPTQIALRYVNKAKNAELTSSLPDTKTFIQNLIQNEKISQPEFKNISREGFEIWLWQLEYFTSEVILKNGPSDRLDRIFENILAAKKLNQANVLNRLVWAQLTV